MLGERVAAKLAMRVGIREVTNHAVASHSIVFRIVHVCFRIVQTSTRTQLERQLGVDSEWKKA